MNSYILPTQEAGAAYFSVKKEGPIYMINLLRFREIADYSKFPELAPEKEISGFEAYKLYMKSASPLIKRAGSEVLFSGKTNNFLIGPREEKWDHFLLVKHSSKESFINFAEDPEYLRILGHRTAALQDSRLLPMDMD